VVDSILATLNFQQPTLPGGCSHYAGRGTKVNAYAVRAARSTAEWVFGREGAWNNKRVNGLTSRSGPTMIYAMLDHPSIGTRSFIAGSFLRRCAIHESAAEHWRDRPVFSQLTDRPKAIPYPFAQGDHDISRLTFHSCGFRLAVLNVRLWMLTVERRQRNTLRL